MNHRYKVGQVLELRSSPLHSNRAAGPCEVVSCLPHDRGPLLYRIKSWVENNERVVEETDLTPSAAVRTGSAAAQGAFSVAVGKR